jgi:hypothetical protein
MQYSFQILYNRMQMGSQQTDSLQVPKKINLAYFLKKSVLVPYGLGVVSSNIIKYTHLLLTVATNCQKATWKNLCILQQYYKSERVQLSTPLPTLT